MWEPQVISQFGKVFAMAFKGIIRAPAASPIAGPVGNDDAQALVFKLVFKVAELVSGAWDAMTMNPGGASSDLSKSQLPAIPEKKRSFNHG